jgi:hypothetical protein
MYRRWVPRAARNGGAGAAPVTISAKALQLAHDLAGLSVPSQLRLLEDGRTVSEDLETPAA